MTADDGASRPGIDIPDRHGRTRLDQVGRDLTGNPRIRVGDVEVLTTTRESLHRVAEHLLAATRKRATGEITLVPSPGGFATPTLPDGSALAVVATDLVATGPGGERRVPLTTIGDAAAAVGVAAGFPWTQHPPGTPFEPDAPLILDSAPAAALAGWFALGQETLTRFAAELADEQPSEPQIFSEHFDLGMTAGPVNYGFSPGDESIASPSVYVGPHRLPPPEGGFWNATFGAYRTWGEVPDAAAALDFLREGHAAAVGFPPPPAAGTSR